jgi:H+-translocating NAD(P) transhydrogenase subunit alpha
MSFCCVALFTFSSLFNHFLNNSPLATFRAVSGNLPFRGGLEGYTMDSVLNWITANQQIIYIVILMIFVGIEVIGRVPSVLHTPLMSGANAIHGVVIIGAIIVMGKAEGDDYLALVLGFLAVILGTLNVVGGFVVTDRMLEMFKKKKK